MTIKEAEDKNIIVNFTLIADSTEVFTILNYLGRKRFANARNIAGLFVGDTSNGDYSKVYGFRGSIPYNDKQLFKIK